MKDEKIYMTAAAEIGTVKLSNGFRGPIEQPSEIVPINAPIKEITNNIVIDETIMPDWRAIIIANEAPNIAKMNIAIDPSRLLLEFG